MFCSPELALGGSYARVLAAQPFIFVFYSASLGGVISLPIEKKTLAAGRFTFAVSANNKQQTKKRLQSGTMQTYAIAFPGVGRKTASCFHVSDLSLARRASQ